jgi:hypothetical protein
VLIVPDSPAFSSIKPLSADTTPERGRQLEALSRNIKPFLFSKSEY